MRRFSWRRSRAAAVVDGADMGVITSVPAERATEEAAEAADDASMKSQDWFFQSRLGR